MKQVFKIRYNTDYPVSSKFPWRVIEIINDEWKEMLAMNVHMYCRSETSMDILPDGRMKYHISIQPVKVAFTGNKDEKSFDCIEFFD